MTIQTIGKNIARSSPHYLSDDAQYTLSIGLQRFLVLHQAAWPYLIAASTVITIPIILLFFFTQRTFIQGIALTGLKG